MHKPDGYMTAREVAQLAGLRKRTVLRAVVAGEFAGAVKTTTGHVMIPDDVARRWVAAREVLTPIG